MIGSTIGHYTIETKLGEGGMGVVYKAIDTKLDRTVALKFLPDHISVGSSELERFVQEARAAAALNHPNICTIYGIEEADRRHFIVMEFVDGQMLEERKASLTEKQALEIGIQIAEGLAAAHEKGIVHRDIKPENVMIRKDGRVQIMDFGLAKLRGASRLTKEGSTVGTAGYMAPEQIQGQETDHRADIFSLGVLLFEMLTGQAPFKGMHETAIAYEIVNVDSPPMSSIKPEISPELDAIVMECLEKDPNERMQAAKQVANDLKRHKRSSSRSRFSRTIPARSYDQQAASSDRPAMSESPVTRYLWPAVSALLLVTAGVLAWAPWRTDIPALPVMRFTLELPENSVAQTTSAVDVSRDGKMFVYTGGTGVSTEIMIRRIDELKVEALSGTSGAQYPAFSPDGKWVAFDVAGSLMKIPVAGGASLKLCNIGGLARGIHWENDEAILFGHINRGIYRVSANGGVPEPVTTLDTKDREISHRFPQLMPDGKTIIYTIKHNNISTFDDAVIVAERMDTHERKVLVRGGTYGKYSPSGHLIYARAGYIYAVRMDPSALEVHGSPVAIEKGGWENPAAGDAYVAFSPSGLFVFSPSDLASLGFVKMSWLDRNGTVRPLLDSASAYTVVALSPDGQKLAVVIQAANDDIWLYHMVRGSLTRFTFGGGNFSTPVWSPDGKYVAYASEQGPQVDIFRKPWDGSSAEERLTTGLNVSEISSYSPDGKTIAFVQNGDIWVLPLDGERTPTKLIGTPANEATPRFSPDGKWLAYSSNESGIDEIYVVPFRRPGGKHQISSGGGSTPYWTRDGKELFFVTASRQLRGRRESGQLKSVQVSGSDLFDYSATRVVLTLPPSSGISEITGDGRRFILSQFLTQNRGQDKLTVVVNWFDELKAKMSAGQ